MLYLLYNDKYKNNINLFNIIIFKFENNEIYDKIKYYNFSII